MRTKSLWIHVLLLLALVSAGVSPACETRAAPYDLIEICGAMGIKTIAVPSTEKNPTSPSHKTDHDCGFCFAATPSAHTPDVAVLHVFDVSRLPLLASPAHLKFSARHTAHAPRGPPAFVS
ncbi:MAG: hypothetical protein L6Q57_02970 [Alphaproteobacteria bacterium]|nr:hypothetical protein [Alphaproteobacteria bacterium]